MNKIKLLTRGAEWRKLLMLFFSNGGHIQGGHSLEEAFNGGFCK